MLAGTVGLAVDLTQRAAAESLTSLAMKFGGRSVSPKPTEAVLFHLLMLLKPIPHLEQTMPALKPQNTSCPGHSRWRKCNESSPEYRRSVHPKRRHLSP